MTKIKKYQSFILSILSEYAKLRYSNMPDVKNHLIADKENHRYLIMSVGWDEKGKFVHDSPIHLDIINGKIWVQWNMTDFDLDKAFAERRVPKSDIVIGFYRPTSGNIRNMRLRDLSIFQICGHPSFLQFQ